MAIFQTQQCMLINLNIFFHNIHFQKYQTTVNSSMNFNFINMFIKQIKLKGRADSKLGPSQWEMLLQSKAISHWLGTNLESALKGISDIKFKFK